MISTSFFRALLASFILHTAVSAHPLPGQSNDSTMSGVSNKLPFPVDFFTKTVASIQNSYCGGEYNYPGIKIGDQVLNQTFVFSNGDQRVNIYISDSLGIVVAYEGTNSTSQLSYSYDHNYNLVSPDEALGINWSAYVGEGWQTQFKKSWDGLKSALKTVIKDYPNKKVQVAGHSQGAAIAQLASLAIYREFGDVIERIVCYGPPRVGNTMYAKAFNDAFQGKYVGVVNGDDWVPMVPPQVLGYEHPAGMVWINPANSTSWKYFENGEDPRGPDSNPLFLMSVKSLSASSPNFDDHSGIYMHSSMGAKSGGPCPAQVGGNSTASSQ